MGNHSGGFFLHSLSMTTKLKNYFPMIRSREEILKEIDGNIKLTEKFYSWGDAARQEFLDFCTGVRGVKLLYDPFFLRDHESGDCTGKAGRFGSDTGLEMDLLQNCKNEHNMTKNE